MKIDLVGPRQTRPGHGLQRSRRLPRRRRHRRPDRLPRRPAMVCDPQPFLLGSRYAALGLGLSALAVRETRGHAGWRRTHARATRTPTLCRRPEVFVLTSFREPALSSASQAGLVNNLNDGLAWGLFPILFATSRPPVGRIGGAGRHLPSRLGRRPTGHRALCRTGGDASTSSPPACSLQAAALARDRHRPTPSPGGRSPQRSSVPVPRWSTRLCSPPSATSPIRPGAPGRSASTGSGATSASPSGHS